jgi:hypothetical protein
VSSGENKLNFVLQNVGRMVWGEQQRKTFNFGGKNLGNKEGGGVDKGTKGRGMQNSGMTFVVT